jgi:hypothetical protein
LKLIFNEVIIDLGKRYQVRTFPSRVTQQPPDKVISFENRVKGESGYPGDLYF